MPIKPENRERYPANWSEIVEQVRKRSGNRCEFNIIGIGQFQRCGAVNGQPHPETGSKVVLTVAHLDHIPEHCDMDNLLHGCQKCHNAYDAEHRAQTRKATRNKQIDKNQKKLFRGKG